MIMRMSVMSTVHNGLACEFVDQPVQQHAGKDTSHEEQSHISVVLVCFALLGIAAINLMHGLEEFQSLRQQSVKRGDHQRA
ncbi:hypothetical protein WICPIJ_003628 [Wickerhamomyces pijperi]|uniref:Uncharacterized protein n=1 Tax=Wickerhamomyces pijperi TaxID=599730 RepID=A0A9P8Q9G6_WICPI|nr:hypothetical protein WICPIJ_003628 [Wickerhamomyces pijperi]